MHNFVENQSPATRKQTAYQGPPLSFLLKWMWGVLFCRPGRRSISIMVQSCWLSAPLTAAPPELIHLSGLQMQGGPSVTEGSLSFISHQGIKQKTWTLIFSKEVCVWRACQHSILRRKTPRSQTHFLHPPPLPLPPRIFFFLLTF